MRSVLITDVHITCFANAKKDHVDNSEEDPENFRFLVVGYGQKRRVIKVRKQN